MKRFDWLKFFQISMQKCLKPWSRRALCNGISSLCSKPLFQTGWEPVGCPMASTSPAHHKLETLKGSKQRAKAATLEVLCTLLPHGKLRGSTSGHCPHIALWVDPTSLKALWLCTVSCVYIYICIYYMYIQLHPYAYPFQYIHTSIYPYIIISIKYHTCIYIYYTYHYPYPYTYNFHMYSCSMYWSMALLRFRPQCR